MTQDEARKLSPDDRVMFERKADDLGTVRRVDAGKGVRVDWDNGMTTYLEFDHELWPDIDKAPGSRVSEDDRGDERASARRPAQWEMA